MRRTSGLTALAACLGLVLVTVLATGSLIAANAWTPVGERPAATPRPGGGPGGPVGPGGPPDEPTYEAFLADVSRGIVFQVDYRSDALFVDTEEGGYRVTLPPGVEDPLPDILAAAADGGVNPPGYMIDGQFPNLGEKPYPAFLADVEAGVVSDVGHQGAELNVSGISGYYRVELDDPGHDVLGDIEDAARRGGVRPPGYSKYPAE